MSQSDSHGRIARGREIVAAFRAGATPTEVCGTFGCSRHTARRLVAIAMSETVAAALNLAAVNAAEHQRAKTARFVDARRLARMLAVRQ